LEGDVVGLRRDAREHARFLYKCLDMAELGLLNTTPCYQVLLVNIASMKFLATIVGAASLVELTWAHGYVDNATIGGAYYQFYQPYSDPYYSTPVSKSAAT
jgi:hypothetical protein